MRPRPVSTARIGFLFASLACVAPAALAQSTPFEGLRENPSGVHALINARIVTAPGAVLARGTVVIRNGLIEAVGAGITPPADARVWDLSGRTVYPGFIDGYASVGMVNTRDSIVRGPVHWNPQMRPHLDAAAEFADDEEGLTALRSQGFTVALVTPRLGVFRGQGAIVSLGDGPQLNRVIRQGVAQSVAFERSNALGSTYPTSDMGGIAFIRQGFLDADWYARAHDVYTRNPQGLRRPETNMALAALVRAARGEQPVLFEARSEEDVMRTYTLAKEFPIKPWIRGSGEEYRIVDAVRAAGAPLILPLDFPQPPSVDSPEQAMNVSVEQLRHWYLAPENPGRLARAGVQFALTSDGLGDDRDDFLPNLRIAVQAGLADDAAIAALTTTPARLLGIERTHGTIAAGKVANLVVVEGDLLRAGSTVRDTWVDGRRYVVTPAPEVDPRGRWSVTASGARTITGDLAIGGTPSRLTATLTAGGRDVRASSAEFQEASRRLQLEFPATALGAGEGAVRLSASMSGARLNGLGDTPDGGMLTVRAERTAARTDTAVTTTVPARPQLNLASIYPAMEFGRPALPARQRVILVRNATVWSMGAQGRMEGADVLVRDGRVAQVGRGIAAPAGATVIDATGKHVTPGLIDVHLHAGATGGVNETGSAIVPEVRIGDVLTANNIWTYRGLAGGLTTAHVMHGSANPIGGQNQIVKMRWGSVPDALKFEGAPRTVKFALGENPIRRENRYPDTRMGTHEIIREHFKAAREYEAARAAYERNPQGIPPRRDLRMDAIVDILNGGILVQSHSYRQDEILMLMRLAEEFGFRIKAFQHAVEAYKVAPELAAHGAGAAVWADWSSFKVEAYDATVYNARLLTEAGVLTSLHSDNSQLSTRMNWEAGKMVRAGMSEVDALALVTINAARILGIEARVGSLEAGKDGDFVIWSANPLSTTTRAEQTWIEGRKFFDLEDDLRARAEVERERAMLITAARSAR